MATLVSIRTVPKRGAHSDARAFRSASSVESPPLGTAETPLARDLRRPTTMFVPSDESDAAMAEEAGPSLGYERTRIASERTLMAWVRTAVSLIGFGFSIPKFFGFVAETEHLKGAPGISPRILGVLLIALGTLGLAGGVWQHIELISRVAPTGRRRDRLSVALVTAVVLGLAGVLAIINVLAS